MRNLLQKGIDFGNSLSIYQLYLFQNVFVMKHKNLYTKLWKFAELSEGTTVEIQIMRTGKRNHPVYGEFEVTPATLQDVVKNFAENKRGIDLAVDENHEWNHIALWWIRQVFTKDNDTTKLFATVELTQLGAEKLSRGEYKYFSPEIIRSANDDETGETIQNLLIGWAFTNRPYFKGMQSVKYNEDASNNDEDTTFYLFSDATTMDKLLALLQKLLDAETMEDGQVAEAETMYADLNAKDNPDATAMFQKVMDKKAKAGWKFNEDGDAPADETPADETPSEDPKSDDEEKPADETPADDTPPTDEQPADANNAQFTDPATGKTVSVSFAEFNAMQKKLEAYAFAEKQKNVSDKLSSVVFSEDNKKGIVLPKHKDKLVEFAMWLSDDQLAKFSEILTNATNEASVLFGEQGSDGEANLTREQRVDAKAKEIMVEKQCNYKEAMLEANKMFTE